MSSLPKSIRQQIEDAQKHYEPAANPEANAPTPEPETVAPAAPDTAAQSAEPDPNDEKHSQPDEPKRSESYWEHRFNVINGKYAAEVPALRDEVKSLKSAIEQKDLQMTEMKDAPAPTGNIGGLTDAQIQQGKDEFGEDFVSFVQQMIDSKAAPADNSKMQELEGKVRQFEERELQKTQASFWTVLGELAPDWKTINADPKFHAFLAQYDPQTGKQRQSDLVTAQQALDADGVGRIFNAFKVQQPEPQRKIPDDQIDPQSSRTNAAAPQGGHIWTGPEIKQFYQEKAQGKFGEDEGQKLEADIFRAQSEGRIR